MVSEIIEYNPERIDKSRKDYERLREQLRNLSVGELEESDNYRELIRLQDRLVEFVTDAPEFMGLSEHTGIVAEIRGLIRPPDTELRTYLLYSMLAGERDTKMAYYLHGRQK